MSVGKIILVIMLVVWLPVLLLFGVYYAWVVIGAKGPGSGKDYPYVPDIKPIPPNK